MTREVMVTYRNWMKQEALDGRGYSNATFRQRFSCLKQCCERAQLAEFVARNPVELVTTYRLSDLTAYAPLSNA